MIYIFSVRSFKYFQLRDVDDEGGMHAGLAGPRRPACGPARGGDDRRQIHALSGRRALARAGSGGRRDHHRRGRHRRGLAGRAAAARRRLRRVEEHARPPVHGLCPPGPALPPRRADLGPRDRPRPLDRGRPGRHREHAQPLDPRALSRADRECLDRPRGRAVPGGPGRGPARTLARRRGGALRGRGRGGRGLRDRLPGQDPALGGPRGDPAQVAPGRRARGRDRGRHHLDRWDARGRGPDAPRPGRILCPGRVRPRRLRGRGLLNLASAGIGEVACSDTIERANSFITAADRIAAALG